MGDSDMKIGRMHHGWERMNLWALKHHEHGCLRWWWGETREEWCCSSVRILVYFALLSCGVLDEARKTVCFIYGGLLPTAGNGDEGYICM